MTTQDYFKSKGIEIGEWQNQVNNNQDELILSNILRRKTTVGTLPRLNEVKKENPNHQKKYSQIKLKPALNQHIFKKQTTSRGQRQKTEGFKELYGDSISPLKQKLIQLLNEQDQEPHVTLEYVNDKRNETNKKNKNQYKDSDRQCLNFYEKYKLIPKSKNKQKRQNSQKQIQKKKLLLQQFNDELNDKKRTLQLKQTLPKMYMRLNALGTVKKVHKNVIFDSPSPQKLQTKNTSSQKYSLNHAKSVKNSSKKKLETLKKVEQISEKLRQTFTKQDMFQRQKRRKQKLHQLQFLSEFNDQLIFTNNSAIKSMQRSSEQAIPIKLRLNHSPNRSKNTIN